MQNFEHPCQFTHTHFNGSNGLQYRIKIAEDEHKTKHNKTKTKKSIAVFPVILILKFKGEGSYISLKWSLDLTEGPRD